LKVRELKPEEEEHGNREAEQCTNQTRDFSLQTYVVFCVCGSLGLSPGGCRIVFLV
jgi:hypothetical protein